MMILAVVACTALMVSCSEQTSPIEELEIKEVPSTDAEEDNPAYNPFDHYKKSK